MVVEGKAARSRRRLITASPGSPRMGFDSSAFRHIYVPGRGGAENATHHAFARVAPGLFLRSRVQGIKLRLTTSDQAG